MNATINHSKAIIGARGLALSLSFFMMLMGVLPTVSRARATGISGNGLLPPAMQLRINGPTGSGGFGLSVTALPNGNIVVTDPFFSITSPTTIADVGAVYLYNGATGALISLLTGSNANDRVGNYGVTVLSNGNYVVRSPVWNGARGAVTWGNGTSGISGVVSATNSLVGGAPDDRVGGFGDLTALANGNYVVRSPEWHNGALAQAGAVTWGNGATGTSGTVSVTNSLVGSSQSDQISSGGVTALVNGNYVVRSPLWSNGGVLEAGAVTWGNGATGIRGPITPANSLVGSSPKDQVGFNGVVALPGGNYLVRTSTWHNSGMGLIGAVTWGNGASGVNGLISAANSLVGSTAGDEVGFSGVAVLSNGNYVVGSSSWSNGALARAGAVTWGNGATGIHGEVSAANSLIGSAPDDRAGSFDGVTALANGNYVVVSPEWHNGAMAEAGAVTWGNGATGISGPVSAANSLIGSSEGDQIGSGGVTALVNGNYVVRSPFWDNIGAFEAGAVTWGNGATGTSGVVSAVNSLVGSSTNDRASSYGVTALANGNYVVVSPFWRNGAIFDTGAVTWGNGATGVNGLISAANSLVGSTAFDNVGIHGVTALANGNYVVSSANWSNGAISFAGAATWGNGTTGISGPVSAANSLVGSAVFDRIGFGGATALSNGNYVVSSQFWNNGAILSAGAVTWGNGATGISGMVSAVNSLVGSAPEDMVSSGGATALPNGMYVVSSPRWDDGAIVDAGAITFGLNLNGGTVGPISASNSVLGTVPGGSFDVVFAYDSVNQQLVVGQPNSNSVTLFRVVMFDLCLQDDSNSNTSVAFNTQTGDYLFCAGGAQYSGKGVVTKRGSTYMLQHNTGDRRVQASLDATANRGTASLQKLGAGGGLFSLTDRDIRNDTCPCATH